ncbi:MAG: FecR domain-containing protein [Tannerella sp.]|jgi:ferric-dicitrate binding protein FerR (iron transport regulator)|nr:FecR domain-containing protein [Tannerella sp.]
MTVKDKIIIDRAWDDLRLRLELDGLLPLPLNIRHCGERSNPVIIASQVRHDRLRKFSIIRAASVAATLAICVFTVWHFTRSSNTGDGGLSVLNNEAKDATLAKMMDDGSVVYLAGLTRLQYPDCFANDKREVTLKGEAFFEIREQPSRPFFVDTDIAEVCVTGTSFKIRSDGGTSFLLSVREGEVQVTQKKNRRTVTVREGESVYLDNSQMRKDRASPTVFDEYFSRIQFRDEPLGNIAAIINLHSDSIKLAVAPEVRDRLLTFTYSNNVAEVAELICLALNLRHFRQDNIIHISNPE